MITGQILRDNSKYTARTIIEGVTYYITTDGELKPCGRDGCGNPVPAGMGGRQRKYCSNRCKDIVNKLNVGSTREGIDPDFRPELRRQVLDIARNMGLI